MHNRYPPFFVFLVSLEKGSSEERKGKLDQIERTSRADKERKARRKIRGERTLSRGRPLRRDDVKKKSKRWKANGMRRKSPGGERERGPFWMQPDQHRDDLMEGRGQSAGVRDSG